MEWKKYEVNKLLEILIDMYNTVEEMHEGKYLQMTPYDVIRDMLDFVEKEIKNEK